MKRFFRLTFITLLAKLFTIFILALLSRELKPGELAYIALIPSVAYIFLSLSSFGVNTLLERDAPKLLATNPLEAMTLMKSGVVININTLLFTIISFWFFSKEIGNFLTDNSDVLSDFRLVILPLCAYLLIHIVAFPFQLQNKIDLFGFIKIYSDISAKSAALGLYYYLPCAESLLLGLAIGQAPFILLGLYLHRTWLFHSGRLPIISLLKKSSVFYIESILNALRNWGDSILVSSLIGAESLAVFYIAKRISDQISVFFQPFMTAFVPFMSSKHGMGKEHFASSFKLLWTLIPAIFILLSSAFTCITPILVNLIAGEQYANSVNLAIILTWNVSALAIYSLSARVLLIIGSSIERFRITVFQIFITFVLIFYVFPVSAQGIALSWLAAVWISIFSVIVRAKQLKFDWPSSTSSILMTLISVPPAWHIALKIDYKEDLALYVISCFGNIAFSLMALFTYFLFKEKWVFEQFLIIIKSRALVAQKRK
ncbi:MAG: oligosaccharide flippase family protein [Hydrogenophaga sp.]|nr:oligosaccharide flippase family protein [Sulfuricurvum sp.]MDZ4128080.1 oligosaccharide flippase family protein [Hydrogenophaga sp.]